MNLIDRTFHFLKTERGFFFTGMGKLSYSILGAIFWLILASILSVSEYGEINYYIAVAQIPASLAMLGMGNAITTFLAKGEEELLREACSLVLFAAIVASLIMASIVWQSSLLVLATAFFYMSIRELLGRRRYKEYALVNTGFRISQIALSVLLYFKLGIVGVLVGYTISLLIFSYRYLISLRRAVLRIKSIRRKFSFVLHSYGLTVMGSLANFLDKIMIGSLFGFFLLGIYQLGYQFFAFLYTIPAALFAYLLPEESSGRSRRSIKVIGLILTISSSLALALFSPWIVFGFFHKFIEGLDVIRIMILASIPAAVVNIKNAEFFARERSKNVFLGSLVYVLVMIPSVLTLGKFLGGIGLAISLIVSQSAQAIYLTLIGRSLSFSMVAEE